MKAEMYEITSPDWAYLPLRKTYVSDADKPARKTKKYVHITTYRWEQEPLYLRWNSKLPEVKELVSLQYSYSEIWSQEITKPEVG